MIEDGEWCDRDLSVLVVPPAGRLVATGDRYEPYRMLGSDGVGVEPVTVSFRDLLRATTRAAGAEQAAPRGNGSGPPVLALEAVTKTYGE